jgi:LmbE family N-acetylglucosaminyl deacetylase
VEEAWWKASEGVLADRGPPHRADRLYFFETTDLFTHPSVVIDISTHFERKMQAVQCYASQFAVMPGLVPYVENLARTRGYFCQAAQGEAFVRSNFLSGLLL